MVLSKVTNTKTRASPITINRVEANTAAAVAVTTNSTIECTVDTMRVLRGRVDSISAARRTPGRPSRRRPTSSAAATPALLIQLVTRPRPIVDRLALVSHTRRPSRTPRDRLPHISSISDALIPILITTTDLTESLMAPATSRIVEAALEETIIIGTVHL